MLQSILGLYLQGLLLASLVVVLFSLVFFLLRAGRRVDKSVQERQEFLFDLLTINVMTIPILAFGMMAILIMIKA